MESFKSALKRKYSNKTIEDFEDIENAPTDYDLGRRTYRKEDRRKRQAESREEGKKDMESTWKNARKLKDAYLKKRKLSKKKDVEKKPIKEELYGEVEIGKSSVRNLPRAKRVVRQLKESSKKSREDFDRLSDQRDAAVRWEERARKKGEPRPIVTDRDITDKPAREALKKSMKAQELKRAIQKKYKLPKR